MYICYVAFIPLVTQCYRVLQSVTQCYTVLHSVTQCYTVLFRKSRNSLSVRLSVPLLMHLSKCVSLFFLVFLFDYLFVTVCLF